MSRIEIFAEKDRKVDLRQQTQGETKISLDITDIWSPQRIKLTPRDRKMSGRFSLQVRRVVAIECVEGAAFVDVGTEDWQKVDAKGDEFIVAPWFGGTVPSRFQKQRKKLLRGRNPECGLFVEKVELRVLLDAAPIKTISVSMPYGC